MSDVIPNAITPPLGPDGRFTLGWYRYLQRIGSSQSSGTPGPAGPAGPSGPAGPPGTGDDTLAFLTLAAVDGTGAVTSIASTTADLTVSQPTGDVTLTVNSAPKWDTARTLSFTGDATGSNTVDGSADVATALTLATVNANVGTWGDATHVGQLTVNAKGLVTAAANVAITYPIPTFGTGAPSTLVSEGALYFDTTGSPYVGYVQHSGAWHQF